MVSFNGWKHTIYLYCSANVMHPQRLKSMLAERPEKAQDFRARFEIVLRDKPFTAQAWEDEFDTSFDEDEEVHAHLQAIYDYLFLDGPIP